MIIADDIIFKNGWYEDLEASFNNGDIIGFSMLKPNSNKVLDYGYDFILVNNTLSTEGRYKGENSDELTIDSFRECDAVCGCCMIIKKQVLESGIKFQQNGYQRWGELIFSYQAKEKGFSTIVLSSYLYHHGISSKKSKNKILSSISWLIESELWSEVVSEYFSLVTPIIKKELELDDNFKQFLTTSSNIALYGCGTIANLITKAFPKKKFKIFSGLEEEVGKTFNGNPILSVSDYSANLILVNTALGHDQEIYSSYFKGDNSISFITLKKYEKLKNKKTMIGISS